MRVRRDHEAGIPQSHRVRVSPAAHGNEILRLQWLAGNAAVSGLLGKKPLQRLLDEDFKHGGKPTEAESAACHAFAEKVSGFVDQAYAQLMAGDVKGWGGGKIAIFLNLLLRNSNAALPWAGNAIEERVYELMKSADMGLSWVAQFAEGMGAASKPDIVITLSADPLKQALIDITSEREHILKKVGGWTTSERYVYVAEAYFPKIKAQHLETIRDGVKAGGLDAAEVAKRIAAADAERERVIAARQAVVAAAREEYNLYGTVTRLAVGKFGGNKRNAVTWMRANGLGTLKGVPKLKGRKGPSDERRKIMRRLAAKSREEKAARLAAAQSHDESSAAATGRSGKSGKDVMEEEVSAEILTSDESESEIEDEELV